MGHVGRYGGYGPEIMAELCAGELGLGGGRRERQHQPGGARTPHKGWVFFESFRKGLRRFKFGLLCTRPPHSACIPTAIYILTKTLSFSCSTSSTYLLSGNLFCERFIVMRRKNREPAILGAPFCACRRKEAQIHLRGQEPASSRVDD